MSLGGRRTMTRGEVFPVLVRRWTRNGRHRIRKSCQYYRTNDGARHIIYMREVNWDRNMGYLAYFVVSSWHIFFNNDSNKNVHILWNNNTDSDIYIACIVQPITYRVQSPILHGVQVFYTYLSRDRRILTIRSRRENGALISQVTHAA